MPISIGLRYQAWEDGIRTPGPGWSIGKAFVRWFEDEDSSCEDLLGL